MAYQKQGFASGQVLNAYSMNHIESGIYDSSTLVVSASLSTQTFSNTTIITNASVKEDMAVINSVLSNPSAQSNDWIITTANGSVKLTGTASAATTLTLYLQTAR